MAALTLSHLGVRVQVLDRRYVFTSYSSCDAFVHVYEYVAL